MQDMENKWPISPRLIHIFGEPLTFPSDPPGRSEFLNILMATLHIHETSACWTVNKISLSKCQVWIQHIIIILILPKSC